jgi:hypothetical protein
MSQSNNSNPLVKYFRQPQLYIKLPSKGQWYVQGSIDMPITKELPVYSMTAKDELSMQSPDALLSGQTTVDLIHSCVPNIKNAWAVPVVDLDYLLIGIRRATYGNAMDFVTVCPHCKRKNENTLNLQILQDQLYDPKFDESLIIEDLELFLQPQNFKQLNYVNIQKFESQKLLKVIDDQKIPEMEKLHQVDAILKQMLELTIQTVSSSITAIKTNDGTLVQNKEFIDEFLRNCNKKIWESIRNKLESIAEQSPLKNIPLTCEHKDCGKEFTSPLVFEMSNFFV